MKILYISPENTVGTLSIWKKAHEEQGNECNFITLYKTRHRYDEGICFNLPLISSKIFYRTIRHNYYKIYRGSLGDYKEKLGNPPIWKPNSNFEQYFFKFRDWIWHFKIEPYIEKYNLYSYDIYHFEWGLEFYRDCRFAKKLIKLNKKIVCTYHGQDLRTRGVIKDIDTISLLNLTSEFDLLKKHPNINYLFLPYNTQQDISNIKINSPIRIFHNPSNRYYKGSDIIIPICEELSKNPNVEFIFIENKSHKRAEQIKRSCDILIDQIGNRGGLGYGMNSIEALSMGLCCITELTKNYEKFIPDHPFINANSKTLLDQIKYLINNPNKILEIKQKSINWVNKYHDYNNGIRKLYSYYTDKHII